MGRQDLAPDLGPEAIRGFTKALLDDLRALETIVADGQIESGITRIGAEQELFLVDHRWRPVPIALAMLDGLDERESFTTELALFNLETNLDPLTLTGDCFSQIEGQLQRRLTLASDVAATLSGHVVMTGILPSLSKSDLALENITPKPRYHALNEALTRMRGGAYRLRIDGTDELHIEHDSAMLEACNTSFQVHLQVSAEEFASCYNVAQMVTAPVLAASVNSPLLFGRRLWDETRIALFQQSVDTRNASPHLRELAPRVSFGDRWVEDSVVEIFQEDIVRFRVLMATQIEQDPFAELEAGRVPRLEALQLHNSTVYRWNRPCYGISEGKPHLRIECRSIPAGPSAVDEIANAAFWIGSVVGGVNELGNVGSTFDFDAAKSNFLRAARHGLNAVFTWADGSSIEARELILERMLPMAREGLVEAGVDSAETDHYLGIVRERVETGRTGAWWQLHSLQEMRTTGTPAERLTALTAATRHRQQEGEPGHRWEPAQLDEAGGWRLNYLRVEQYMTTDLYTVNEDELVELVAFLMDKKQIRHVLVEDTDHRLVGIVSYRSLIRMISRGSFRRHSLGMPVKDIMKANPITIIPETPTAEAIRLMRTHRVPILPVLKHGQLVGVVTEADFMPIANQLLEDKLREEV